MNRRKRRHRPEVRDELQFHLDALARHLEQQGMDRDEAEREAAERFGSFERYHDAVAALCEPDARPRRTGLADGIRRDLILALRSLRRAPGFAMVVVITLALGIGANTALFSVVSGVLLRPLGFRDPDRLVTLWDTSPTLDVEKSPSSVDTYFAWREQTTAFASLAAWTFGSVTLELPDESVELNAVFATGGYLSTLGVTPLLGRILDDTDEITGQRGSAVMLSHPVWRDRFGSDRSVIGRTIQLDGSPTEIVGVMPANHLAPNDHADLWLTAGYQPRTTPNHGTRTLAVIGRLAPGATIDQARAEVRAVSDRIAVEQPTSARGWTGTVIPIRDDVVGPVRGSLTVAFVAVGLLLLIACINIANLLLARAASRDGEMALRSALGAGRGRLARQLLTESLLIATLGGAAGLVVAVGIHRVLLALEPGILPRLGEVRLNVTVLGFGVILALVTGAIFGLAPVLHAFAIDLGTVIRGGNRGATGRVTHHRVRRLLVTGQVALTLVLLSGAGLLTRTVMALRAVDPGFDPNGVVAARMFLDARRYGSPPEVQQYYRTLLSRLRALPGVTSAGMTSSLPMDPVGTNFDLPFRTEATAGVASGEVPQADFRVVSAGYFETMRVPLLRGRLFDDGDLADAPRVMLVNRAMATLAWPGGDPVGRRVETVFGGWTWYEVVGVVDDTHYYGLDADPRPEMYVAQTQSNFTAFTVVARTTDDVTALAPAMTAVIHEVDAHMPAHSLLPVTDLVGDSIAAERFYAALLGAFAVVAMLLAATGLYGVLSYWVQQRRREIGVRIALGAGQAAVIRMVVGNGMRVAVIGIGLGLAGSLATTRVLSTMLFGVTPYDPATIAGVCTFLAGTALLACFLPAFRAGRVHPLDALRHD